MSETNQAADQPHDFDTLKPVEFNFTYTPKGDKKRSYVLREASADAAIQYRALSARGATGVNTDGKVSVRFDISKTVDIDVKLVAMCAWDITDNDQGKAVAEAQVRKWPSQMIRFLFDKAKEISPALNEKPTREALVKQIDSLQRQLEKLDEEDASKNSHAGTPSTSD